MNPQNQLQDLAKMVLLTSAFGVSYCVSREFNKRYFGDWFDKDWSKPIDRKTILPFLCEAIVGAGFAGLGLVTLTDALNTVSSIPEIDDKDTSEENNEEKNECSS